MKRFNIFVGLNDPITHKQQFSTEKYTSLLKKVCKSYKVSFSFAVIQGGYFYEDGDYADESTLFITLYNQPKEMINEISRDLCTFFKQESVMITETETEAYYLHGDEEVKNAEKILKQ